MQKRVFEAENVYTSCTYYQEGFTDVRRTLPMLTEFMVGISVPKFLTIIVWMSVSLVGGTENKMKWKWNDTFVMLTNNLSGSTHNSPTTLKPHTYSAAFLKGMLFFGNIGKRRYLWDLIIIKYHIWELRSLGYIMLPVYGSGVPPPTN